MSCSYNARIANQDYDHHHQEHAKRTRIFRTPTTQTFCEGTWCSQFTKGTITQAPRSRKLSQWSSSIVSRWSRG